MRIIFIICVQSFFNSILNIEKEYDSTNVYSTRIAQKVTSYYKYNLQNNLTQTFYNLTKDIKYYFILEAQFLMTATVKINMNLSSSLANNNSITVQEIKNKDNISDFINGKTYIIKYNFYPIVYTLTYPSSKYLLLNYIPKYNISYFSIIVDLKGEIYTLSKNFTKRIYNLNSNNPFYFILESNEEYNFVNISFKSNNFISSLDYCELTDKSSSVKFYKSINLLNTNINNKEIIATILYYFDSISSKYKIIIYKLPPLKFSFLNVQSNFYYMINNTIYFRNNTQVYNLVKGNIYIFKSYSSNKNINITITLNEKYSYILPFNYLLIKEYSSSKYDIYNYARSSNKSFSRIVKNGKLFLTCNHSLYYYSSYLLIQIIPNENVPNFDIKLNYLSNNNDNTQKSAYSNYKSKNKSFIIAMIVASILIVSFFIIIIFYKYKKKKYINELNITNLNQNKDAHLINEPIKNNEDELPYYNNQQEDHQSYQEFNDYSYNKNSNDYMSPYDQAYRGQNRNDQQYFNFPNNNQNLGNFTIN